MKRLSLMFCLLTLLISMVACGFQTREDKVLASLGKYESEQFWTSGEFQDYTDFGVYTYDSVDIEKSKCFTKASESNIKILCAYVDDFERWISASSDQDSPDSLARNYTFDRSIMDTEDYFYKYEKDSHSKFECYDVWFFDSQTKTLYYFHNNI